MHHISVGGGIAGLLFTVGSLAVFLVGIPALWGFLGLSVALGAAIAAGLAYRHRARP